MPIIFGTSGNDVLSSGDEAAVIRALEGDDILFGGGGDDWLEGGDGFDQLDGGTGSDTIYGGAGDDVFNDDDEFGGAGNDQFFGEDGWDSMGINRRGLSAPTHVLMDGGGGPDVISFSGHTFLDDAILIGGEGDDTINAFQGHIVTIDAGTGDDRVALYFLGAVTTVTLGSGKDFLVLNAYLGAAPAPGGSITVTDFATGAGGDRLELLMYLVERLTNWDPAANPFASHLRLVQDGVDTLLQLDSDGAGTAASFATLLRLQNVAAGALGVYNLGGYAGDGSAPVPATIGGTAGLDQLWGTGGNDLIQGLASQDEIFGGGGNDRIEGGDGYDLLYGQYGDDLVFGDAGIDNLIDQEGGNDQFFGGTEGDYLVILRKDATPVSSVLLDGGEGNDRLDFNALNRTDSATMNGGDGDDEIYIVGNGQIAIDAGAGADLVQINYSNAHVALTLGAGADRVNIKADAGYGAALVLVFNDFAAGSGAGSDVLDLSAYLTRWLQNWNGTANPFGTHHLHLAQSGADTLLILDRDGVLGSGDGWTVATFRNTDASTLTALNLGYAPGPIAIQGTSGNDDLQGTAGADHLEGLAGNDQLAGLGGDDILEGGAGDDEAHGGDGDDAISELSGANDKLYGEDGNDRLTYQSGPGAVTVLLDGGAGDDVLDGRGALDDTVTLNGGGGSDRILVGLGLTVSVDAGDGADLIQVNSIYAQEITLGAGADLVVFDDLFWEHGGIVIHDFAAGDAGDSINLVGLFLGGFPGAWTNPFGSGAMKLYQSGADAVLELDTDFISGPSTVAIFLRNVQASSLTAHNLGFAPDGSAASALSLSGSAGVDFLTGRSANDTILGNGGNDVLFGAAGNDYLVGGDGADELYGQFGNDTLEGAAGDDRLAGNVGDDVLNGGADADRLAGGLGNDTMFVDNVGDSVFEFANEGYDVVAAGVSWALTAGASVELLTTGWIEGTASINLTGNEQGQQFWGNNGVNILSGGDGYDELFGFGGNDDLRGEAGPDALFGGAGNDTLRGGLGTDTYFIDDIGDVVVELAGEGSDVLAVGFDYALAAGVSIELMTTGWIGGPASIAMTGNELGNEIWGNDGVNVIHGGSGNATDALFGFGGNDRLDGGGGLDLLIGGAGQDSFAFTSALDGAAADIIGDFSSADDTILLDDAIFTGLALGALNPGAFVTGTAALDADDRILYDAAAGKLYFDADGNGAGAAILFATLSGNPALAASDFMVI